MGRPGYRCIRRKVLLLILDHEYLSVGLGLAVLVRDGDGDGVVTGFEHRHQEAAHAVKLKRAVACAIAGLVQRGTGREVTLESAGTQVGASVADRQFVDGQVPDAFLAVDGIGAGIRLFVVAADEQLSVSAGHALGILVVRRGVDGEHDALHVSVGVALDDVYLVGVEYYVSYFVKFAARNESDDEDADDGDDGEEFRFHDNGDLMVK